MPKFIIDRELPDAGRLSPADLHGIPQKSRDVLGEARAVIDPITAEAAPTGAASAA